IPVAKALAERYVRRRELQKPIPEIQNMEQVYGLRFTVEHSDESKPERVNRKLFSPFIYQRRQTYEALSIGNHNVPRVFADFSDHTDITPASLFSVGYRYSVPLDK